MIKDRSQIIKIETIDFGDQESLVVKCDLGELEFSSSEFREIYEVFIAMRIATRAARCPYLVANNEPTNHVPGGRVNTTATIDRKNQNVGGKGRRRSSRVIELIPE